MNQTIDAKIITAAKRARDNAYAPYSDHPVGAIAECDSGEYFAGANVESAHYKGLCAEAVAIGAMVSAGYTRLRNIYVIGPGKALCTPCGDCRQRIGEFATDETRIHVLDSNGKLRKSYLTKTLLPDAFGPENLDC